MILRLCDRCKEELPKDASQLRATIESNDGETSFELCSRCYGEARRWLEGTVHYTVQRG